MCVGVLLLLVFGFVVSGFFCGVFNGGFVGVVRCVSGTLIVCRACKQWFTH